MGLLDQELTEDNCPWEIELRGDDQLEEGEGILGQPGVSIYGRQ